MAVLKCMCRNCIHNVTAERSTFIMSVTFFDLASILSVGSLAANESFGRSLDCCLFLLPLNLLESIRQDYSNYIPLNQS